MKRLLVTGADGFVGRWLIRAARTRYQQIVAAVLPDAEPPAEWQEPGSGASVDVVRADLLQSDDLRRLADTRPDAVVHLAAVASTAMAREDPELAQQVNAIATRSLADLLAAASNPRFLFISSGEVYGAGHAAPIDEHAPVRAMSSYADSKAAAEIDLARIARSTGLPVIVARAFPHSGPGQSSQYVLPALAARLIAARRTGAHRIPTGNLDVVRDFLDVRDVVRAYLALLEQGQPDDTYNVASGTGRRLRDCFDALAKIVGVVAEPVPDASLLRPGDIPVLIGDAGKLRRVTGWSPDVPFDRTLQDLVDAQTH